MARINEGENKMRHFILVLCMMLSSCATSTKQTNLNMPKREIAGLSVLEKQLFRAVKQGNVPLIKELYPQVGKREMVNKNGQTLSQVAFEGSYESGRHIEVLKTLHNLGHNINQRNAKGNTTAHLAAGSRWVYDGDDVLRLLHERGYDLGEPNVKGNVPAHKAANKGRNNNLRTLHELGYRLDVPGEFGDTPIKNAIISGKKSTIRTMHELGYDVNASVDSYFNAGTLAGSWGSDSGSTFAVDYRRDSIKSLEALHELGVDLTRQDRTGSRPAHEAARVGNWRAIEKLHDWGYDLNLPNSNGDLPVHIAAKKGKVNVLESLYEKGYSLQVPNSKGETPLQIAEKAGKGKAASYIRWSSGGFLKKAVGAVFGCGY